MDEGKKIKSLANNGIEKTILKEHSLIKAGNFSL